MGDGLLLRPMEMPTRGIPGDVLVTSHQLKGFFYEHNEVPGLIYRDDKFEEYVLDTGYDPANVKDAMSPDMWCDIFARFRWEVITFRVDHREFEDNEKTLQEVCQKSYSLYAVFVKNGVEFPEEVHKQGAVEGPYVHESGGTTYFEIKHSSIPLTTILSLN
jgi:hypothetical protein